MSCIGYDRKSSRMMIVHPRYLRRLTQGMRCDEILGQGSRNLEGVPNDFLKALIIT